MLDLHQLQVFIAAAELLNFSQAGVCTSVSQALLSIFRTWNLNPLQLRSARKSHQLSLTDNGSALLPLARRLVITSLRTEEMMSSINGDVNGHLQIGCSTTPGKYRLPLLMADFMRMYPSIQATCHVTSRNHVLKLLATGKVDFALSSSHEVV